MIALCLGTVLLLLSSCGSVQVKDAEVCTPLGIFGAHCKHTLTTQSRDLTTEEWASMSFGQVCTADPQDKLGQTFSDIKETIEKLCSKCNCCTYESKKKIDEALSKIQRLQEDSLVLK